MKMLRKIIKTLTECRKDLRDRCHIKTRPMFFATVFSLFLSLVHDTSLGSDPNEKSVLVTSNFCPNMDCDFLIDEKVEYSIPAKMNIYERKDADAKVVAVVEPGENVKLLESHLDLLPGKGVVGSGFKGELISTTPYSSPPSITLKEGEIFHIYQSMSEGYSVVKFNGNMYQADAARTNDHCKDRDAAFCWNKVLKEPRYVEWLKVKSVEKNTTGWLHIGTFKESEWDGKIHTPVVAQGSQTLNFSKLGEVIKEPGKYTYPNSKCRFEIQRFDLVEGPNQLVLINPEKPYNEEIAYITSIGWISQDDIVIVAGAYGGEPGLFIYSCIDQKKRRVYPQTISKEQENLPADSREFYVLREFFPAKNTVKVLALPNWYTNESDGRLIEVDFK